MALSGNSVANTLVGDAVLVNIARSFSRPAEVFPDLLSSCGVGSFVQVGPLPDYFRINGALTEYRRAIEWLSELAFQCRGYFRMQLGQGRLLVRPEQLGAIKAIPAVRVSDADKRILSRKKAPLEEVVNRVEVLFERDWSKDGGAREAYRSSSSDSDAQSAADYGTRERPSLFMFDFVTDPRMAEDLVAFYLGRQAARPWVYEFETYLDQVELEFSDGISLDFLAGQVVEIIEAGLSPGSVGKMDAIRFIARG